jgi:hypothetical protein
MCICGRQGSTGAVRLVAARAEAGPVTPGRQAWWLACQHWGQERRMTPARRRELDH